jgi:cellulose synthase/poly-beta-1,6-N-acetylglucosamine synthase-like glycosyltransferase
MTNPGLVLEILGWALGFGAVATTVVWAVAWICVEQSIRWVPTLRRGQSLAEADPPTGRVCVVVPAHNEERVIAGFVRSLRAETYPQLRVVLASIAVQTRPRPLSAPAPPATIASNSSRIDSCPDDWAGQGARCHAGVTRSVGARDAEYLLFADADTVFEPGCIAASLALMRERKLDLLSLLSTDTGLVVRAHRANGRSVRVDAAVSVDARQRAQGTARVRQRPVHAV